MIEKLPYGTWPSPISAERVASASRRFAQVQIDKGCVYWVESRPEEGGRSVLVCCDAQENIQDVVPENFGVRSRVHEYGGVAYIVQDGVVHCSSAEDGCIYRVVKDKAPQAVTPDDGARYADFAMSPDGQSIFCVRERHLGDGEPINDVVCVQDGQVTVLAEGNDFYAAPRISPDGRSLAWMTWSHPNMPWDETQLWVATWNGRGVDDAHCICGGDEEAIFQPTWGQNGYLYFVSDKTGWWNLYCWQGEKAVHLWEKEAEFGLPLWSLGMAMFAEVNIEDWVCAYIEGGGAKLGRLNTKTGKTNTIDLPFTDYSAIAAQDGVVAFVGGAWDQTPAVVRLDLQSRQVDVIRENEQPVAVHNLSRPRAIDYPSLDGETVHAWYYPPHGDGIEGLDNETPPLLVKSHGGPTGASSSTLDLSIQYWTSRGFAVLDVNYRGSTGYGRAYRHALDGKWGIFDVQDCVAGAGYLVEKGWADGARLLIRGGSAGGLTTLGALAFYDMFKGGASYYGVSDLASLAKITHKFESQYLNRLMGEGDIERIFRERSPLFAADQISAPVVFLQGTEDPVVPPSQTETMADALRQNGVPVACVMFEGEMHGFRKGENIIRALQSEHAFYVAIFELDTNEKLSEIKIENRK